MDHGQLSIVADKFQWVFSEALLNACGKAVKFCRRQRIITPLRLGLALTATCASQRVETIADLHCGFHALFGTTITYNSMIKFFVLDVLLRRVGAVSSDPAPDSALAPSFLGRPLGQLPSSSCTMSSPFVRCPLR